MTFMNDFERYEFYILDWIYDHGYTFKKLAEEVDKLAVANDTTLDFAYQDFLDQGFDGGMLWVCFGEFMEYENANGTYKPTHNSRYHRQLKRLQKTNHYCDNRIPDGNISDMIYLYFSGPII